MSGQLQADGVSPLNEPMSFLSRRLQYFEGPEGITLELVEWIET